MTLSAAPSFESILLPSMESRLVEGSSNYISPLEGGLPLFPYLQLKRKKEEKKKNSLENSDW